MSEAELQKIGLLDPPTVYECWNGIIDSLNKVPHFWDIHTPEHILLLAIEQKIQVWLIGDDEKVDLLVITEVISMSKLKILRLMAASGEKVDVYAERLHDVFEGYAKIQGCARIEIQGRPGWLRKYRRFRDSSYDMVTISRAVETRSVQ